MAITVKIACALKQAYGNGSTAVTFQPDYADGRNKEWAAATPALLLQMTVKGAVADQFEPGRKYTLTFEPADEIA